jgi:hypothetical protein
MAKRQPAAAISQNQYGREMIDEPDEAVLEDVELDEEEVPEVLEPLEVEVAEEEPGELVVREVAVVVMEGTVVVEGIVVVSGMVVMEDEDKGIGEFGGMMKEEEVRVRNGIEAVTGFVTEEEPSLVELGLEGAPVSDELELDDDSVELGLELEADADEDEPEVDVAVAANATALDAAALADWLVDVTFKLKLDAANVTLLVACHVSVPNWSRPKNMLLSTKLFVVRYEMSGAASPLKSVMFWVVESHEWTVCPPLLAPENRVKLVLPITTPGWLLFTTPNGLTPAPRGKGSLYAPIQIIISYLAAEAFAEVAWSGSKNISYTTLDRVSVARPPSWVKLQLAWRFMAERSDNGRGNNSVFSWTLGNECVLFPFAVQPQILLKLEPLSRTFVHWAPESSSPQALLLKIYWPSLVETAWNWAQSSVVGAVIVAAVVLVANNKEATERRGKALEIDANEDILLNWTEDDAISEW